MGKLIGEREIRDLNVFGKILDPDRVSSYADVFSTFLYASFTY